MSLIKFLLYKKKDKSVLASKQYGKGKVEVKELETSILAKKKYNHNNEQTKENIK